MERIKKIHPQIRRNVRYKLTQKLMEDNLMNWFNLPQTQKLISNLIKECKQKSITIVNINNYNNILIVFAITNISK